MMRRSTHHSSPSWIWARSQGADSNTCAAQRRGPTLEHLLLDLLGKRIIAPSLSHQRARAFGVALRMQRARKHNAAYARLRRRVIEEAYDLRRLDVLDPKHPLRALAEHAEIRPARIGGNEGEIALALGTVVVVAQDEPFHELACYRVRDAAGDLGRLAGAAVTQRLDCALDQRNVGGGRLRRWALRQRN